MMYAVNKRTKEHRIADIPQGTNGWVLDGCDDIWNVVQADADGWIEWSGHGVPVPYGSLVDVRRRNGATHMGIVAEPGSWWVECIAYRPILDTKPSEPEAPEWSGEGLPPVGVECEVDWSCGGDWRAVKIIHYSGGKVWVRDTRGDHIIWEDATFRPIRSEEDRLVEQALKDISAEPDEYGADGVVYRMIKAGYRKTGGDA